MARSCAILRARASLQRYLSWTRSSALPLALCADAKRYHRHVGDPGALRIAADQVGVCGLMPAGPLR